MRLARRSAVLGLFALLTLISFDVRLAGAQQAAVISQPVLSDEQQEQFLLKAKVLKAREINKGITGSKRATLSDGQLTHDAQIQNVDISKFVFTPDRGQTELNFRDSYRFNIAAYKLSRLLGLDNVPVSVERRAERDPAAVTWWIDDVSMDEQERLKHIKLKTVPAEWKPNRTAGYIHVMRVFDELISNNDRNLGNQLWSSNGKLWMIDHTRAFRFNTTLKTPRLLERCDRTLLAGMRKLSEESITAAVGKTLSKDEIQSMLARRDLLVKHFEERITARGSDATVLYDLER
jgi:hypothetical protein